MVHRACDVQGKGRWLYFGRGGGGLYFGVCFIYYYYGYVFIILSNIGLCVSVKVSFICNICLLKLYMWNRSSVFSDWLSFRCVVFLIFGRLCHMCVRRVLSSVCLFLCPGCASYIGLQMYVLFVWSIWLGIHCILIAILHFDYNVHSYLPFFKIVSYCISRFECYSYISVFEYFCDFSCIWSILIFVSCELLVGSLCCCFGCITCWW
jgi:hypothetical protein